MGGDKRKRVQEVNGQNKRKRMKVCEANAVNQLIVDVLAVVCSKLKNLSEVARLEPVSKQFQLAIRPFCSLTKKVDICQLLFSAVREFLHI